MGGYCFVSFCCCGCLLCFVLFCYVLTCFDVFCFALLCFVSFYSVFLCFFAGCLAGWSTNMQKRRQQPPDPIPSMYGISFFVVYVQGGPLSVINGVITSINGLING